MAIALPAFLNQANKPRTASNSDSKIDPLTGMSEARVGGEAFGATTLPLQHYAGQVHRLSNGLLFNELTHTVQHSGSSLEGELTWNRSDPDALSASGSLVSPQPSSSGRVTIGSSANLDLTYGLTPPQFAGDPKDLAWSIGFSDVSRPSAK